MAARPDKPLVWLVRGIRTPPFSKEARVEAGFLLRQLQQGVKLGLPQSRPMPKIGPRCHELRIRDQNVTWRIVYRLDSDAVVLLEAFAKKTTTTPLRILEVCRDRIKEYDAATEEHK